MVIPTTTGLLDSGRLWPSIVVARRSVGPLTPEALSDVVSDLVDLHLYHHPIIVGRQSDIAFGLRQSGIVPCALSPTRHRPTSRQDVRCSIEYLLRIPRWLRWRSTANSIGTRKMNCFTVRNQYVLDHSDDRCEWFFSFRRESCYCRSPCVLPAVKTVDIGNGFFQIPLGARKC